MEIYKDYMFCALWLKTSLNPTPRSDFAICIINVIIIIISVIYVVVDVIILPPHTTTIVMDHICVLTWIMSCNKDSQLFIPPSPSSPSVVPIMFTSYQYQLPVYQSLPITSLRVYQLPVYRKRQ